VWAKFPWFILYTAGVIAMVVAARIARPGVPLAEIDKENLSIR
jgi:hypothetical protein